jgi:hypothetical protein
MLWVAAFFFAAICLLLWDARRRATKDIREANQFLRDMGAPTGLKIKRK